MEAYGSKSALVHALAFRGTPYPRITTPAGLGLLVWGSGSRVGVGYREKALRLLKVVVCGRIRE